MARASGDTLRTAVPATMALVVVLALAACSSSKPAASAKGTSTPTSSSSPGPPASSAPTSSAPASSAPTSSAPASSAPTSSGGSGSAIDDTYYPVGLGNTWVYKLDYGAQAATRGLGAVTDTERMIRVEPVSGGTSVTMSRSLHYATGLHPDFVSTEKLLFHHDGSVSVPYQNNVAAAATSVVVKSGDLRYPTPADLAAGKVGNATITLQVTTAGRTLDARVAVAVKGAGTASVTVPAGSYRSARILDQTLVEHVTGLPSPITLRSRTYLVKGVGMVKTTVGGLTGSTVSAVLVSYRKG